MITCKNVPLYEQIKTDLLFKIENGIYENGKKLPSERVLAKEYNVSRVTIRNTIDNLVNYGILYRRHGSGTYVKEKSIERPLARLYGVLEELNQSGYEGHIKTLGTQYVEASEKVARKLGINKGDRVYRIDRYIAADDKPLQIGYNFAPIEIGMRLENINTDKDVLYTVLDDFGYHIEYADQKMKAGRASQKERKLLELEDDTPVMCVERVIYGNNDKPLLFSRAVINGDRYSYRVHLERKY